MTRIVIALFAAALVAATTYKAPPAQAGVRIGFGIPLGAFMATPSRGPSYNRGTRRSKAASGAYRQKKAYAASARAAERAKIARAQRERAIARAEARAAARASAQRAAAKASVAKADDKAEEKASAKVEEKTEKKTTEAAATSTSTGVSEPKPLAPAPVTPPSGPVDTTVEPAMVQTTATMSVPDKPVETVETAKPDSESNTAKKADCKKFVPSVGLTITVPCN